jgi:glycosyltransferase involved in cell wall biosynthesis
MKVIVSVTPLQVAADSRTFKIASSFSRFGYHSIVVEAKKSALKRSRLPFELFSVGSARPTLNLSLDGDSGNDYGGWGIRKKLAQQLRKNLPRPLKTMLVFLAFLFLYFYRNIFRVVVTLPDAAMYYLHAPYQFPAVYLASMRNGAPIIYDAHDYYPVLYEKGIYATFYKKLESWCIRKAAATVTVSDGVARLIRRQFGCKPIVMRNCEDRRLEQELTRDMREVLGVSPDTFLLVVVGQAKPGQALLEMLEAMTHLPAKVHVAFLGRGYEKYWQRVKSLGLEQRVHIVLPVKPFEVVPFIKSADAALLLYYPCSPNYLYCLPNGFFQPVAAELPIIYPELPEIKRIAEQYELGIPIDPQSPKSITRAVLELMQDPERLSMYRRNARRVGRDLSWEREEGILRDLIRKALSSV